MTMLNDALDRNPAGLLSPIAWTEYRAELAALYAVPHVAKATASMMAGVLRELDALGIATTADLNAPLIARYIESRPKGQSKYTLHRLLRCLNRICGYAELSGYLRINPFRLRKISRWVGTLPPPGQGKKRHCTRAEIKAVWDLAARDVETRQGWAQWRARRLQVAFAVASLMGLRRNELLLLQVDDVDISAGIIWVRPHGKALKTRTSEAPLPIPDALKPILASWLAHRMDAPYGFPMPRQCPWLVPTVDRQGPWIHGSSRDRAIARLRGLARRAGVDQMTWQMLRRSCAIHLESHGVGRATIKRILRHATERVSEEFYSEPDLPNLRTAVQGFTYQ